MKIKGFPLRSNISRSANDGRGNMFTKIWIIWNPYHEMFYTLLTLQDMKY